MESGRDVDPFRLRDTFDVWRADLRRLWVLGVAAVALLLVLFGRAGDPW